MYELECSSLGGRMAFSSQCPWKGGGGGKASYLFILPYANTPAHPHGRVHTHSACRKMLQIGKRLMGKLSFNMLISIMQCEVFLFVSCMHQGPTPNKTEFAHLILPPQYWECIWGVKKKEQAAWKTHWPFLLPPKGTLL